VADAGTGALAGGGLTVDQALGQGLDRRVLVRDGGVELHAEEVLQLAGQDDRVAGGEAEVLHRLGVGDLLRGEPGDVHHPVAEPPAQLLDGHRRGCLALTH
jgi:hypothetical protein